MSPRASILDSMRRPALRTSLVVTALAAVVATGIPRPATAAPLPSAPASSEVVGPGRSPDFLIPEPSHPIATDRLGGIDRYATSVAISARTIAEPPTPVVYLASGAGFADALAAGPAAAKQGGGLLLTRPDRLPAGVAA